MAKGATNKRRGKPTRGIQGKIAAKAGVSQSTVSIWMARPDWPFGRARIPKKQELEKWREEVLGTASGETRKRWAESQDRKRQAELDVREEDAKLKRLKRGILEDRYVLREDVDAMLVARATAFRDEMMRVPAVIGEAESLEEARRLVKDAIESALRSYGRDSDLGINEATEGGAARH